MTMPMLQFARGKSRHSILCAENGQIEAGIRYVSLHGRLDGKGHGWYSTLALEATFSGGCFMSDSMIAAQLYTVREIGYEAAQISELGPQVVCMKKQCS